MSSISHRGTGVSPGIAIGPALVVPRRLRTVPHLRLPAAKRGLEAARLDLASATVRAELAAIAERANRELGSGIAQIIDAQLLMLDDSSFLDAIRERITGRGHNAEWAVQEVGDDLSARFSRLADAYVRERGNDVDDLAGRLLRQLCGIAPPRLDDLQEPVILIAHDLSPADAAVLDRSRVLGFATDVGGGTSHTAIMARSLEIPAVAGVRDASSLITTGDMLVLDGGEGVVVVNGDEAIVERYRHRQRAQRAQRHERLRSRDLPAVTPDGFEVRLLANIESAEEVEAALQVGACGVGLYRSEYLYLSKGAAIPGEEEHFQEYRAVVEGMAPWPVSIRTLDLGGEKDLPGEFSGLQESNALLGLRAIRRSLHHPETFEVQLRALLRASGYGDVRIVLPLVTSVDEVREARAILRDVREQLLREGHPVADEVPLGIMLEVPAAALIVDHLAAEADFFSVGTNDLVQYVLAVDRSNEAVSALYEPLHPAVLRLLDQMARTSREHGVPLSVCGESASDPMTALVLLGLRVQEMSMTPSSIPVIRNLVRHVPLRAAEDMVSRALQLRTAREVTDLALQQLVAHFPDGVGSRS